MRRLATALAVLTLSAVGACGGSGSSGSDGGAAGAPTSSAPKEAKVMDVCGTISTDDVGAVLGATVTSEVGPFDACEYDQEDPRATSAAIDAQSLAELGGGYESYKSGTSSTLTGGDTVDLDGVGDKAFITTGSLAGGANTQLQGAVVIGGQLVSVNLTQGSGVKAPVLVDQATQLLKLAAGKA
jgi:hypothetical protein